MKKHPGLLLTVTLIATIALGVFLFFYGDVGFTTTDQLVLWQLRFPKIMTAFLAGGLLASSGLLLQVFFQNPLAGPDLLGINAGSCLGVAIAIMGGAFIPAPLREISQPFMAMCGAFTVFILLSFLIRKNLSHIALLILGLLIASFTSSFISVLVQMAPSLQVKNFLMWSMGSFQNLTLETIPTFMTLSLIGIFFLLLLPKKLNQFIIGEQYAKSMGVNVRSFKVILILVCSFLVATVTAFCGPIGFIGIIAPHLARSVMKRSDIRWVMPVVFLVGSFLALITEFILIFASHYSVSTNSILGLIGAPLIALYLYRQRRLV